MKTRAKQSAKYRYYKRKKNLVKPLIVSILIVIASLTYALDSISRNDKNAFDNIVIHEPTIPEINIVFPSTTLENKNIIDTNIDGEKIIVDKTPEIVGLKKTDNIENGVLKLSIEDEDDHDHSNDSHDTAFDIDLNQLRDLSYLKSKFYTVDNLTDITTDIFDVDTFLERDFSIKGPLNKDPQILIFHTHSLEMFADSDPNDLYTGVVGVGAKIADSLAAQGFRVIHAPISFDVVDGIPDRNGSYERMEPVISKILEDYPSIQVTIDLHRDGVADDIRLVTEIDGKKYANVMFFNGLSRMYIDGELTELDFLPNENLGGNLAFSFQSQLLMNKLYPSLARKIYLRAYRFSLHFRERSLLIELGAQTNTMEEAFNSADAISDVLVGMLRP